MPFNAFASDNFRKQWGKRWNCWQWVLYLKNILSFIEFIVKKLVNIPVGFHWDMGEICVIPVGFHWDPREIPLKNLVEIPDLTYIPVKSQWDFNQIFHWNHTEISGGISLGFQSHFHWGHILAYLFSKSSDADLLYVNEWIVLWCIDS